MVHPNKYIRSKLKQLRQLKMKNKQKIIKCKMQSKI